MNRWLNCLPERLNGIERDISDKNKWSLMQYSGHNNHAIGMGIALLLRFCLLCECGTPMPHKFLLFFLSVGFCQPVWAERIIDLGYDLHGSRWRVVRQLTAIQHYLPLSVLSVEFPKLRHFRQHRDVKTVRLVVRLMCEKRDMAIEHFVFHDEAGHEVAHLAGNSASHGYAELLPLAIKTSLFDKACAESP